MEQKLELEDEWVVQIDDEVNKSNSIAEWESKHSIYKVPSHFTELHEKAYTPKVVSFGPYHNRKEHLKPMEEHKHRALIHFLKKCGKSNRLFFQRMEEVVQELRDSYKPLDEICTDTPKFLRMMILDGCFMLQILRSVSDPDRNGYAKNDPIFGDKHGTQFVVPYITRDILMLENQLPMKVLRILIEVETHQSNQLIEPVQKVDDELNKLILKFFGIDYDIEEGCMGKCEHVLDLYRKGRLHICRKATLKPNRIRTVRIAIRTRPIYAIFGIIFNLHLVLESPVIPFKRSVKELRDFGIRFRKSDTDDLKDVTFDDDNGVLRLPHIQVDDNTRYIFLNLIAFEHLHVEAGNEVTSYVYFMDSIIDNEVDVEILHKKDIIRNGLESNIAVAQMFNSLAKDITVVGADIKFEQEMMADYCRKWWKKWRANLLHTYFRNPWSTISFYAAIFLFALTIVQTVFTVLQYYEPKGPSSSPSVDRPPRH